MKSRLVSLMACGALTWGMMLPAHADTIVEIDAVPTGWKLENYPGNGVVVWYTPATCNNGELIFGSTATIDDINRFWALLLSALITQQQIFVRYDTTTCNIASFGIY